MSKKKAQFQKRKHNNKKETKVSFQYKKPNNQSGIIFPDENAISSLTINAFSKP